MLRRVFLALAAAAAVVLPQAVGAADPYEINAILSMTGQGTFIGERQWQTIQIAEATINRSGGIAGRPVKFVLKDDQSNPQVALQLAQGLIAEKAPLILGPSLVASCNAITPLVQHDGPVLYCLTAGAKPQAGGYVFATLTPTPDMIAVGMRYFVERGWKKMAAIVTNDAGGQDAEQGILAAATLLQNKGIDIVDREHFAAGDISIAAQISKIKAAEPQVLLAWVTGTAAGTVLHAVHDAGLTLPILLSSGNMSPPFIKQYGPMLGNQMFLSAVAYFAGTNGVSRPTRAAMEFFARTFRDAGTSPDQIAISAWDPTMLLVDALRKIGPDAAPVKIRDYLIASKGWVGASGSYDFRTLPQRGVGQDAIAVLRWDAAKGDFVPASRAGGMPLPAK